MSLDVLLNHQKSQLELLLDITGQELDLIVRRQALELPPLTERKQTLLREIQATDAELAGHPERERLKGDYREQVAALRHLLQQCQEQNQVTEQLLEQSLNGIRQLSNILSRLHERQSMTYDQKGHTRGINKGVGFKV
ncbi:flagella synthesis protein FlgN [Oceanisphaera psychrotolerans]|uniref:Flagellar biosynthesis protein FlgN n=1 Tax=Oceanisphaera psychrotolerans TaxID=1414654 RepID=A0A1J4QCB8_9GAMM|nr:flagellar protein FlgN [Oceanisphaera psychrotolerans]OIN07735.1 flagellar biosynthesis protein FlgN [Oceanisphaera psychrotolerans]